MNILDYLQQLRSAPVAPKRPQLQGDSLLAPGVLNNNRLPIHFQGEIGHSPGTLNPDALPAGLEAGFEPGLMRQLPPLQAQKMQRMPLFRWPR